MQKSMKSTALPVHHLELRVRELGQLFNSMDPTPFLNKDLDREAEAFIETWAMAQGPNSRLHITVHLENLPVAGEIAGTSDMDVLMSEAAPNFFNYKAGLGRGEHDQKADECAFHSVVSCLSLKVDVWRPCRMPGRQ